METKQWKRALATVTGLCFAGMTGCTALPGESEGWTAMPLLDDLSNPDVPGYHAGRSRVTGVHFTSLDEGVVVVAATQQTGRTGGAVFGASTTEITDLRADGRMSVCSNGLLDFHGLAVTPDGYVALTDSCALVASHDGGRTFTQAHMRGGGDDLALEKALALRVTAGGSVLVRDTGVVARSATAPGETAVWEDVWAPTAIPSIPAEVPANLCQAGPVSQLVPVESQAAYVGPDGQFQAYVANADDEPQICISHDGGRTFTPSRLTVSTLVAPTAVLFTSEQVGLTWYSNIFGADDAYLRRTTDGGATWSEVPLPAEIQGVRLSLRELFFAPGNTTGWLVGFLPDTRKPLVLKTRDGGASFEVVDGGLGEVLDDVPLFTGFALDEDHVWVGGEHGGLAYSGSGGE